MATEDTPIQGELLLFPESNSDRMPIGEFAEKAYLNYSMYVILDRALPHISDGLKPVQRRIIYAMSELGLNATAKYKKSARTVGDVIGKYHPHGDSAAYEAMVLMAQPFSYRYPIIDGQGNWGSIDNPKSFAAMRYTECRFTPYSEILLNELSPDTVDWAPNFDGTLNEPERLPAQLPNVLLNGSSGIAVGMATDIPPHNLTEIADACIELIKRPRTSLEKLLDIVPAPDFPSGTDIVASKEEMHSIYKTGQGSVRQRAVWEKLPREIVISALPHQVSSARALEQIAAQMKNKKIPMVVDLNDESNEEEPVRIVLELRSNRVNSDALMNHLFATTDLEKSQRVNLNMIARHGRPVVYGLKELLTEWIEFRKQTVRRRLESRLNFVTNRLHVLDGFFMVFLNLDEVIHVIRTYDDAKSELMDQFNLSERQVKSILEIRLRQLAKLEEFKIREEQHALRTERDDLQKLLRSKVKFKQLICQEITTASKKHGDRRRSQICEKQPLAKAFTEEELAPIEPLTVVLSKMGWIRAAKGHEIDPGALSYREGDSYFVSVRGKSNIPLICMDSSGRMYTIHPRSLPSARSVGEPLTSIINPASNVEFTGGLVMADENAYCLLAHHQGKGMVVSVKDAIAKSRGGKSVFRVPPEHSVFPMVQFASMDDLAVIVTTAGRLLIYPVSELPVRAKGAGVRLIKFPKKAGSSVKISCVHVYSGKKSLLLHSGKRYRCLKPREVKNFIGSRNSTGILLPRGYRDVSRITVRD